MVQGQIFNQYMYGGQTSAYETAATRTTVLPRVQRFTPTDENNNIYDYGAGEGANAVASIYGPYRSGGRIETFLVDMDFLKHWVGPKTGAGTVGDPYILTEATTVALNTTSLQPFTFEAVNTMESTSTGQIFIGCVGRSFTVSGNVGSRVSFSGDFIARHSEPISTATSYTASTTHSLTVLNGTWKWGATPSALSGVQNFSLSMSYEEDWDNNRDCDSRFISIPYIVQRVYNGQVGIKMSSSLATTIIQNHYGQASGGPEDGSTSVVPTSNLEFSVELVNGSRYVTLWLDQCSIDDIERPQTLDGGLVVLTFNFTARDAKGGFPVRWWET